MSSFKCKLNLTEKTGIYLAEAIINDYGGKDTIISNGTPDFSAISTDDDTGMYAMEDDYYDEYGELSYYFRGTAELLNNNVIFAGYQWKVIRINGDGSVRIIYNGTEEQFNINGTVNTTGTDTQLDTTSAFNSNSDDNRYIGYMYGEIGATTYDATHTNTTSSTIKGILDSWYATNIESAGYASYIRDTVFCNDRNISSTSGYPSASYANKGYGEEITYYDAAMRYLRSYYGDTSTIPTLKCTQQNDRFTVNNTIIGNGNLNYPVGLITSDETWLAGGKGTIKNNKYYLYTEQSYWTGSPLQFISEISSAFQVYSTGALNGADVSSFFGIRPVINLTSTATVSGDGSATDPYIVISQ